MCGIVGVLGLLNKARVSMFEDMLTMDATRGSDSTGVAVVNPIGVHTVKDIVLPDVILSCADYKKAKSEKPIMMLGHNRAATKGSISFGNAHPFIHEHVVMVHNGTLDAEWRLPKYQQFDTDSEAIAYNIATRGIEAVWPVIDGAATLVWWDDNQKTLNVISNNKRPFFMQPFKKKDGLAWASERWMFLTAAQRTGVELHDTDTPYSPSSDTLYTIRWKTENKTFTFTEKKLEPFKYGNTIKGYTAVMPSYVKKKKKKKKTSGGIIPFKSAEESAQCFMGWKDRYVNNNDKYSDENLRKEYPELFDTANHNNGTDADLDTRDVPFRPKKEHSRTAARFRALFNLVELNVKHMIPEWFLTTHIKCISCETPFDYNDYFTARVVGDNKAVCELCQSDLWVAEGITPDQIRLQ